MRQAVPNDMNRTSQPPAHEPHRSLPVSGAKTTEQLQLEAMQSRLVRIETRLVVLMRHHGLDSEGNPL